MRLSYKKDKDHKDILTDRVSGQLQVMMEWEKPYMEALVKKLNPSGDVLEIGFGLGYSANAIQKYDINTHTIIECDTEVLKKLQEWAKKQKHKVIIVKGSWQKKLPKINRRFDSFFMDDYPFTEHPDPKDIRIFHFYFHIMKNNVNKNARLTWFCGHPITWPCGMWMKWDSEVYDIIIPDNVKYITNRTINKLYLPLVTFTCNSPIVIHPIIIEKFTKNHETSLRKKDNYDMLGIKC